MGYELSDYLAELVVTVDADKVSDIISAFEMWLQELSVRILLELFEKDCTLGYELPLKLKVYFAGLTEYLYNLHERQAPDWVSQYCLDRPEIFYGSEILLEVLGEGSLDRLMSKSVKEFRDRNLIVISLLDAV